MAAIFLGLALAARFARGANLPLTIDGVGGQWFRPYQVWSAYAFHLILLLTLLTVSLIQWDRRDRPFAVVRAGGIPWIDRSLNLPPFAMRWPDPGCGSPTPGCTVLPTARQA